MSFPLHIPHRLLHQPVPIAYIPLHGLSPLTDEHSGTMDDSVEYCIRQSPCGQSVDPQDRQRPLMD